MVKVFKTHRGTLDFDKGFISGVIRKDDNANVKKECVFDHTQGTEVEKE
jgi:hypothetical protein